MLGTSLIILPITRASRYLHKFSGTIRNCLFVVQICITDIFIVKLRPRSHSKWQSYCPMQSLTRTDNSHVQNSKDMPSQQFVEEINKESKNYFSKSLWLATSSTH